MMNKYVIGDIHGGYKALLQCIERSNIDKEIDQLICLGDVADGWPEVKECFDELLTFKNLIYIIGNHDAWFLNWLLMNETPDIWLNQGGKNTLLSYDYNADVEVVKLLLMAKDYHIDESNNLFVHGGYNWHLNIDDKKHFDGYEEMSGMKHSMYSWDRHLWEVAQYHQKLINLKPEFHKFDDLKINAYETVFIGHTSTSREDVTLNPIKAMNVWNLDQGAGWEGKLTIMNVDTEEYFQSDLVKTLYPNVKGR